MAHKVLRGLSQMNGPKIVSVLECHNLDKKHFFLIKTSTEVKDQVFLWSFMSIVVMFVCYICNCFCYIISNK